MRPNIPASFYGMEHFANEFFPDVYSSPTVPSDWEDVVRLVKERFGSAAWDYDLTFLDENKDKISNWALSECAEALRDGSSTWVSMRETIMLSRRMPRKWQNYLGRVALKLIEVNG